jgi:hypothetical protein
MAVLRKTPALLNAMLNISLAHNWLKTSLSIVKLQAALVQALPPTSSPLAQLPGISHQDAQELELVKGAEGKKWVEKAVKKDLLSGEAKELAQYWPRLEISDAEFAGRSLLRKGSEIDGKSLENALSRQDPSSRSSSKRDMSTLPLLLLRRPPPNRSPMVTSMANQMEMPRTVWRMSKRQYLTLNQNLP